MAPTGDIFPESHRLPFTEDAPENNLTVGKSSNWETLVNCAAIKWTQIALEWNVIRLPSYMDPDSDEVREYEKLTHNTHDQHERNEYLRLKKKFGASL